MTTRKAYGMALAKLGRYNERVVAVDGDTNNLTYSEIFKNEHPNRFVECYIAQQNMVGCLDWLTSPEEHRALIGSRGLSKPQHPPPPCVDALIYRDSYSLGSDDTGEPFV